LKNLTPLVQYKGKTLAPLSGESQNFSDPVWYTVTPQTGTAVTYGVNVTNDPPDKNTGIFDFRITNVPAAKVVVGQKPRQDGKIPIVIQAPSDTGDTNMIAAITLSSSTSGIEPGPGKINFGSGGNYQEAVYTVTSQGDPLDADPAKRPATQDYVVVVSEGPKYYYVDGVNGSDTWPDYYNGGSEPHPFKTLAHAVQKAGDSANNISKIFVKGDLTAATETGTSVTKDPDSAFTLDLSGATNKKLTIASTTGATLRGTSGRRVLKISGGADITFENINVTGGSTTAADGGGVYITGNSKVKFSGGNITGNTARNGGGVYITDGTSVYPGSEFAFTGGEISGNTADGMGGGVYVAHGAFDMQGGEITDNSANRQGGGVFVHWGDARFSAYGNSTITGNTGTGSSKAICNRGITALTGSATADYVYIWDHGDSQSQSFILTNNTRITTGIALAYSAGNKNFITFASDYTGAGVGTIKIDLESHLDSSGHFVGQLEPDWLGKTIIVGNNSTLNMMLSRFELNTFTGQPSVYNLAANYKIAVSNTVGTFAKK
jgi:hypothetical protein